MDFLKFQSTQNEQIPVQGDEWVPPGVRRQEELWGRWGYRATVPPPSYGGEGDNTRMPTCVDAEAQPDPPCVATGECGDLLKLARRMEGAAKRSKTLLENAVAATMASKVMLKHAETMTKNILKDVKSKFSVFADETYSMEPYHPTRFDLPEKMIWGAWDRETPPYEPYEKPDLRWSRWPYEPYAPPRLDMFTDKRNPVPPGDLFMDPHEGRTASVLPRYMERLEQDKRAVEYLNLVEAQTSGPASLSIAALAALVAAAPERPGVCRRRYAETLGGDQKEVAHRRDVHQDAERRAQLAGFLSTL